MHVVNSRKNAPSRPSWESLFGGQASSLTTAATSSEPGQNSTMASATVGGNTSDQNALITAIVQGRLQRLTDGKLTKAGQKLEDLMRKLLREGGIHILLSSYYESMF